MARTCLIYGVSTSRKTSQVKAFSQYIYERTGKPTWYMTGDGGSWEPAAPEIAAGLIKVLRISSNVVPLPVIRKISQGYWYDGGEVVDPNTLPNMVPIDWAQCGALFIEGLTAIGQMIKNFLAERGIVLGEEMVGKFGQNISIDGNAMVEQFGNNSRAHYNFVQNQLYAVTMNFASLPCDTVVVTALEKKGEDGDDNRATIIGPDVPGKAVTGTVPAWFWNAINHQFHKVENGEGTKLDLRAHFITFPDPDTGIPIKCKTSLSKEAIAKLNGHLAQGWYDLDNFSLADYLRLTDELGKTGSDELMEWRKKIDAKLGRR